MTDSGDGSPVWTPPTPEATNLAGFLEIVGQPDYESLHRWSIAQPSAFWAAAWEATGVVGERGDRAIEAQDPFWQTRFFPDAQLSFAENLLRRTDDRPAILFAREDGLRRRCSWRELVELTARLQQALLHEGVSVGDRVAAWMPHCPETIALMLATASIGAVFSSTSPDFGAAGVLDRFGQIEPTVFVSADGYWYGGQAHDCRARRDEILAGLATVRCAPVLGYLDAGEGDWNDWLGPEPAAGKRAPLDVPRFAFDQPLYVLYSSGTTGRPKCIVHRAGGVLLKHLVEHQLHCDVRPDDRVFYFTTTGWMMWNWLASALASEATIVCYDGSPAFPSATTVFDLVDEHGITLLGTSASFIDRSRKLNLRPRVTHRLDTVRTITSTGSPLSVEGFQHVYDDWKTDVHLASISGGTDLCGCLVAGDPTSPVYAGEIQRAALGLDTDVVAPAGLTGGASADGEGVDGEGADGDGELVCRNAFPSMPLGFWGDADGSRFRTAYFERFPGSWHQGDFARRTQHGGFVITGRSDATLNPGGVRIGTAEIYRQVEAIDEIAESLVIGQAWENDVRIVLFVVLQPGARLDDRLRAEIGRRIRVGASPRHVPAKIIAVTDLPRTRSGKLTELAVRDVVDGRPVANIEALANPESLDQFANLEELES